MSSKQELKEQIGRQIRQLREAMGLTQAQFGELLTRANQASRSSSRSKRIKGYWIGLVYLPQYLKRWEEAKNMPNWHDLVTIKKIADANQLPFDLPVEAAPQRIQRHLPPGNYAPGESLLLADLPDPLPPMRSGRAYGKSSRIRKWRKPNPSVCLCSRRNPAMLVKYLTAQEFLDEINLQDMTGKHRAVQEHWQRVAEYAIKKCGNPARPFVLVQDLPLDILSLEHAPENHELIAEYAGRSTPFPPLYVSLTDYQLSQDPTAKPKVKNGNHRVMAAKRRGDTIIDAMMTQETWKNIQDRLNLRSPVT